MDKKDFIKKGPKAKPENYNDIKAFAELMDNIDKENKEPISKECEGPDNEMGI